MLTAGEALGDFEGAMEKINEVRFDTVGAALKGIGRTLLIDLVYPIGEAVLPYLNQFANYLQNNLSPAIEKAKSVLAMITPILVGLGTALVVYRGTLAAVVGAQIAFNAVQKISIALYHAHRAAMIAYALYGGGLKGIIQGLAAAQRVLNLTMLANPIVAVAAAVIGLAAAFVVAYKMSDTFRSVVNNAFGTVQSTITSTASFIATHAISMWDGLISSAKELPSRITSALSGSSIGKALSGLFSGNGIMDGLIESIKTGFSSLPNMMSMIAPTIATMGLAFLGVSGPIGILIGGVVGVIGFLYRLSQTNEGVANSLSSAWQAVSTAFAPVIDVLKQGFADFAAEVGPQLAQTMTVISESIVALGPSFAQLGSTIAQLVPMIISLWSQVGTSVLSLATSVLPILLQVVQMVLPMIVGILMAVLPIVIQLITSIIPIILQVAQMILPILLMAVQTIFPVILAIIQMVLPIFVSLLTMIVGVVLQLATAVLPILASVVQMVFPIVLAIIQMVIPIVVMILQTLVAIINGVIIPAINGILAVVQFVFPFVQMLITNSLAIVNGVIQAAMSLLRGDWDGAWNAILSTATTIMNNIISFFSGINLYDVGVAIINGLINGIKSMGGAILGAIGSLIPGPVKAAVSAVLPEFFADGGVVSSPTLAWIGEGGDTETVIPWNNSQRSKDLWLQTGQQIGMLNGNGVMENMQQQIALKTQQNNSTPPIVPAQMASSNMSNSSIVVHFSPQYSVNNPADLQQVQQYAEQDKDDLQARLAEIQRNERRMAFD